MRQKNVGFHKLGARLDLLAYEQGLTNMRASRAPRLPGQKFEEYRGYAAPNN
jgi:hypothetical protein